MKILVTGGTGFTGKALSLRLLEDGHEVVVLDHKEGLRTGELRQAGATVVIGSVADRAVVDRAMQGVEIVHHLAAAFRDLDVPDRVYDEINVDGTRNVLDAALGEGVRKVVYCSTCGVHGNIDAPPGDERSPIAPADHYQKTKYDGEVVVGEYAERGLGTCILRPAAIYGPGDPERFLMIFRRVARGIFPMFGNGKTYYHPLFVENLVDAFILAMAPGRGEGQAYLIADDEYFEIEELVKHVARAMDTSVRIPHFPVTPLVVAGHICERACRPIGITPPLFPRRVDWYRQNRAFDISKARRDLDYAPRVGIEEGLRRTAEWYRAERYL